MRLGTAKGPKRQSEVDGKMGMSREKTGAVGNKFPVLYATFALGAKSFSFSLGLVLVWFGFLPTMKNICMYFILKLKRRQKICCLTLGGVTETKG